MLVAQRGKVKILPSNALVVVVSPLNALISDQLDSCQRLKLKAFKMEQELFHNDDKLTARRSRSCLLPSGNLGKHPIQAVPFKDGQSVDWDCCGRITLCSKLVSLISVCPYLMS